MAQDWTSSSQPIAATSAHLLRPLTTGEVLDNTFALYRSRFWLFAGIASISGAWQVLVQGLQLLVRHLVLVHFGARAAGIESSFSSLLSILLMLPVTAVVHAAGVYALGEIYLSRPVDASQALSATRSKWMRYVGIAIWQGWSAVWVVLLLLLPAGIIAVVAAVKSPSSLILSGLFIFLAVFGGGIYGAIAYIRNALAVPSAVVEDTPVRASMRRSKVLAAGTKGRIFLVLLVAAALYLVAGMVESPLLFLIARSPTQEHIIVQGIMLLVAFTAQTLVSPVIIIGLTLVYFDQRVRKEAFDLQMLLGNEDPAPGLAEQPLEAYVAAPEPIAAAERPVEPGPEPIVNPTDVDHAA
jgi:hypothetical protein